jgi:hypothetical protein
LGGPARAGGAEKAEARAASAGKPGGAEQSERVPESDAKGKSWRARATITAGGKVQSVRSSVADGASTISRRDGAGRARVLAPPNDSESAWRGPTALGPSFDVESGGRQTPLAVLNVSVSYTRPAC